MSIERMHKSENINQMPEIVQIRHDIEKFHKPEKLKEGEYFHIDPLSSADNMPIDVIYNERLGVAQALRCVLSLGDELLSVIDMSVNKNGQRSETTALARINPGKRSQILAFIAKGNDATMIGRHYQGNGNHDPSVSRNHLTINQTADGVINVMDLGSTNGTKVFIPTVEKGVNNRNEDPMRDLNVWSVKSADVKEAFGL